MSWKLWQLFRVFNEYAHISYFINLIYKDRPEEDGQLHKKLIKQKIRKNICQVSKQ